MAGGETRIDSNVLLDVVRLMLSVQNQDEMCQLMIQTILMHLARLAKQIGFSSWIGTKLWPGNKGITCLLSSRSWHSLVLDRSVLGSQLLQFTGVVCNVAHSSSPLIGLLATS